MKHSQKNPHLTVYTPICPNGADNQYFSQKAVDLLTGIASVVGFAAAMVFLVTLA